MQQHDHRPTQEEIRAAVAIACAMEEEAYYGFNLRFVLAEATEPERETFRQVLDRAQAARQAISERRQ